MKKIRFQMDLTDDQNTAFEKMMKKAGIRTKKDLIENALSILKWSFEELDCGNKICSVNEWKGIIRELHMPIFDNIKVC